MLTKRVAVNVTVAVSANAKSMKTYTKTGDKGETSLFTGQRVKKDNGCLWFVGEIDELSSVLGVTGSSLKDGKLRQLLEKIQEDLFLIGANLNGKKIENFGKYLSKRVKDLEKEIDTRDNQLPPLHNFILPGGSQTASLFHLSRSVCRRAERRVVEKSLSEKIEAGMIAYLNRLSDLLFVLARFENQKEKIPEKILGLDINKIKS